VFLIAQLISIENWIKVLSNSTLKLVVVDFDRHDLNAPLVLAANESQIKTVSLVHGVINPPYGFYPLLTDEIWVWGNHQKELMIGFGLDEKRIKLVGNPIAIENDKRLNKNDRITIGIALNPVKDEINVKALNHIFNPEAIKYPYQWIIKLHPAMKKSHIYLAYCSENITVLDSTEISNEDFFNTIDFLILGNSGIGLEALLNNIPLLIYRMSEIGMGHDSIMIEEGKCPVINNTEDYLLLLKDLNKLGFAKQLLRTQHPFVTWSYFKTGKEASKEIANLISGYAS
jgi:hypothetical protein